MAEVLRQNGYSTGAWGKWHNTPDWETSPTGPFDRWPTGQGFEYWYGFQGGETSQWEPQLFRNTATVEPLKTPEEGYHLTEDLTDDAIAWISNQKSLNPDKPYFAYFATGACHAPLHVPQEWIDKFKGQFDEGWDVMREKTIARQKAMGIIPQNAVLTKRPESIPAWNNQTPDAKKLFARQMEVFAAFLAHTDYQVGRLIKKARSVPGGENTIVVYILGDNGCSAEGSMSGTLNNIMTQNGFPDNVERQLPLINEIGSPKHENHFAVPWSWAGSTPFQWMKRVPSHFGGTRNGMVLSWPGHTPKGQKRTQFHHVVDIAPTVYEAAGIRFPENINGVKQMPLAGVSMVYSFGEANAPGKHGTQYFETGGHMAIYKDGWVAASFHGVPWELRGSVGFKNNTWELYNIEEDFSQSNDLAKKNPEKLEELKKVFDEEAKKYQVYPLDDRFAERVGNPNRPSITRGKNSFTYYQGTKRIPEGSAPSIYARSHDITAKIQYQAGNDGVLVAEGGSAGGYSLYVKGGKLYYSYNFFGNKVFTVTAAKPLAAGVHEIKMVYTQGTDKTLGAGGIATLYVDGTEVAKGNIDQVVPGRFSATETLDIGMDLGSPATTTYHPPFAFKGKIESVKFDLK